MEHQDEGGEADSYRERFERRLQAGSGHRRPGIVDVAAIAEVSVGTASDALNGKGRMANGTRARVRRVAEALHYRPHTVARSLRHTRSGVIGLSVRPFGGQPWQYRDVSYYPRFLTTATVAAQQNGYALVALPPGDGEVLDTTALDGVIVTDPEPEDRLVAELRARGIPYVTDLGESDDPQALCVGNDQVQAIATVFDHFRSHGASSIGLIASDSCEDYTTRSVDGARAWSQRTGIPVHVRTVPILDTAAVRASILELADSGVDAFYTTEAPVGEILWQSLQSHADATTGPTPLTAYCAEYSTAQMEDVTRLSLNAEQVAAEAVDLLSTLLAGEEPTPRHRYVPVDLAVRSSSVRSRPT